MYNDCSNKISTKSQHVNVINNFTLTKKNELKNCMFTKFGILIRVKTTKNPINNCTCFK